MPKKKLVYIWSLRNAAADKAGQYVAYKGELRYMKSPLEYLCEALESTSLGDSYSLEAVIYDDDHASPRDREKLGDYGFSCQPDKLWFYPRDLVVQGRKVNDLLCCVPSAYRQVPIYAPNRKPGKDEFERHLFQKLNELKADLVVLDGLLVILDRLVRPGAPYHRKIFNIHPGITRLESPYERRGACATLDALYGAKGKRVLNWASMEMEDAPALLKTGASFHFVDNGIDSGEVVADVLATEIDPSDTILELRWNNFHNSLFPALVQGLEQVADATRQSSGVVLQ